MAQVRVYIDGFNLFYGAVKGTPHKWLDLGALCRRLLPGDRIDGIKYFTAKVGGRPNDADHPVRQSLYLRALQTVPNLEIFFGHFLTHSVSRVESGSNPARWVTVDNTQEKGSDVNLASHLLHDGFLGLYETAVLISNDSDLREPVRMVRQVVGKHVGILNPHQTHSRELQEYATFIKRIREADVAKCQFPSTITDAKGTFNKPHGW
jgi:hypothetical protein